MSENKTGINETLEFLEFGFALQKAISGALSDDKINIMDIRYFFGLIKPVASGLGGLNKVKAELLDLDDAEKDQIMAYTREQFDLPDDQLEYLIEDTIEQLLDLIKLSLRFSNKRAA